LFWSSNDSVTGIDQDAHPYIFAFNTTKNESYSSIGGAIYDDENDTFNYPSGWVQADEISVFLSFQTTKFKPGAELAEARKAAPTT
jgi:hypothetical protein